MDDSTYRKKRTEFLENKTKEYKRPLENTWCESNLKSLLDEHYNRMDDRALGDVEFMLDTGDRRMTAQRQRKDYKVVKVGSIARRFIEEWYEQKRQSGGEAFEARRDRIPVEPSGAQ